MATKMLFNLFKKQYNTPLMHFFEFLMECLQIQSAEAFTRLVEEYQPVLSRDPQIQTIVKQIGESYLGIRQKQGFNIIDMVKGMFD